MRRTGTACERTGSVRGAWGLSLQRLALVASACLLAAVAFPGFAYAAGPNAILTPSGYNTNAVARADDTANQVVGLPFSMNWNGTNYNQIYINMNGNCTFGNGYTGYNPTTDLGALGQNIMAPFWADVDTRNTAMGQVTYSNIIAGSVPQVNGHDAFFVNWINVGRYNYSTAGNTQTNSFQLVIIDRSDTGAGNFDFMYNYDAITWDIATASSSMRARVGWGRSDGSSYELPGSGTAQGSASTLLDSSAAATSLIQNLINDEEQLGRYVWEVRAGIAPNIPPSITVVDRVLEGNRPNAYYGYTGAGDATASDVDGTVVSLTNDLPGVLPFGTTTVTWTVTDDRGGVTTRAQTVTVADTVAPTLPTLASPTHATGVWSTVGTVTLNSTTSTDTCTGVAGASYVWTRNAAVAPDAVLDPSTIATYTTSVTATENATLENQSFVDATWPTDWTRVRIADAGAPTTYLRSQDTRTNGTFAAELYTDANNARRTMGFYRDFAITGLSSIVLSYSDYTMGLDAGTDYTRLEYSLDGGASWTVLRDTSVNTGWTVRTFPIPTGTTLRIRFSGSVNRTNEYCDWDDISLSAIRTTTTTLSNTTCTVGSTNALADGAWYFSLRTVDRAGNWTASRTFGPVLVDRTAPVTTSNAPTTWQNANVLVSLTATDAGQVVSTTYKVNSGANTPYGAPILMSAEGTTTVLFWSADAAGHVEATKTATIRIDKTPPTVPATVTASALSTTSAEVAWTPSTDALSGIARYEVYRDGVLVGSSTTTTFTEIGLTPGMTYRYSVRAVDVAGNASAQTPQVVLLMPLSQIWLSVSQSLIDMSGITPGEASTVTSATTVSIGGIGAIAYDLTCSAPDFMSIDALSPTPTFPIGAMSYVTHGKVEIPARAFTVNPVVIDSAVGTAMQWRYDYRLDFSIVVPLSNEPGTYTTTVTYTFVPK
ncbi:MAG: hypothetical protein D9V44_04325 [Actinobacteria bacterium]|nr:MAG: hypothetical protein D9V44_04325 [Actinomycetota bacterium]